MVFQAVATSQRARILLYFPSPAVSSVFFYLSFALRSKRLSSCVFPLLSLFVLICTNCSVGWSPFWNLVGVGYVSCWILSIHHFIEAERCGLLLVLPQCTTCGDEF